MTKSRSGHRGTGLILRAGWELMGANSAGGDCQILLTITTGLALASVLGALRDLGITD